MGGANKNLLLHLANVLTIEMGNGGNIIPKLREQLCSCAKMRLQFADKRNKSRSTDSRSSRRSHRSCRAKVPGNIIGVQPSSSTIPVQQEQPLTPSTVIKPPDDNKVGKGQDKNIPVVLFQDDNDNKANCGYKEKKDVHCYGC